MVTVQLGAAWEFAAWLGTAGKLASRLSVEGEFGAQPCAGLTLGVWLGDGKKLEVRIRAMQSCGGRRRAEHNFGAQRC